VIYLNRGIYLWTVSLEQFIDEIKIKGIREVRIVEWRRVHESIYGRHWFRLTALKENMIIALDYAFFQGIEGDKDYETARKKCYNEIKDTLKKHQIHLRDGEYRFDDNLYQISPHK